MFRPQPLPGTVAFSAKRTMSFRCPPSLPSVLGERCEQVCARLAALEPELRRAPSVLESALRVTLASEFALRTLSRERAGLIERLADAEPLSAAALGARLEPGSLPEAAAMARLRRARNIEMARIAWRDIAGWAGLDETFRDLTLLADVSVRVALAYAVRTLAARGGRFAKRGADMPPLLVLAMGKLGGEELNYSSDIDLVMLHPDVAPEEGDEEEEGEAETYYLKLAQLLIRLLDQVTEDGFVFRVDTRLRPFGASGPLVVSLGAFEAYLARHGRDWERYAHVKTRLITGLEFERELFGEILTPFVYRQYLDYGVFDALRQMKNLIAQEVVRRDLADNIKLGPGGIREIEFIVQAVQLVRGGHDRSLRVRSLLQVLPRLAETRDLDGDAVAALGAAYRFLRTVENRLQAIDDLQVHALPRQPLARAQLAYALDEASYDSLLERVQVHRARVQAQFARLAWERDAAAPAAGRRGAFQAAWDSGEFLETLEEFAPDDAAALAAHLVALRNGGLYQRMDEASRQRLVAVIARTVPMLTHVPRPAAALERVLKVYAAIGRRSAYLALLNENPQALERLLTLAGHSDFIVNQIADHPLLLDELLDPRLFDSPSSRAEFEAMLERYRAQAAEDIESQLEAMRQFQRAATLRIAVADRLGALSLMKVSDRLTDTAELVLALALDLAWGELTAKYGTPFCGDPPALRRAGFAIIGYGKLGGLELGYGSDLDVVFLHDSTGRHQETDADPPLDNVRFYGRLAQRLIHFLSIQTRSGRLYEIDTRLRPSGRAGPMVSSFESFRRYQREDAWVWEHQALLRSRAVAGDAHVRELFEEERVEVLTKHVKREGLREEIVAMRGRMRAELSLAKAEQFDIKQDPGGLADIEFIVDYLVLQHAREVPELVAFPDNVRQLEALERARLLAPEHCRTLTESYLALRRRTHELALDAGSRIVGESEFREVRREVMRVWNKVFGEGPAAL
jgi:[glutamine synthetase] adenylyltransferase / [glutamine synthetase]-adenylyl-L-tyrosine phosphorylase